MIKDAVDKGLIDENTTIIEPTSGNTGIALAFAAASLGYKLIIVMPDTMSKERRGLIRALGAQLVLTPGAEGMKGAIRKAEELAGENPNSFIPQQFQNQANPRITGDHCPGNLKGHRWGCGRIRRRSGNGRYHHRGGEVLKEKTPILGSWLLNLPIPRYYQAEKQAPCYSGIGAGFVPDVLNTKVIDEIVQVQNEDAIATTRKLAKTEGLLVGISSGAAAYAATQIAKRPEYRGKRIVVVLPDTGERYLSNPLLFPDQD